MSIDKVFSYFREYGMESRVLEFDVSSATVELAGIALSVPGKRIAKTLSFKIGEGCVLIVTVAMALGVAIPRLHPLFADERVLSSSGAQLARKSLIEVPLGTVALEEVVFRSVLFALLTRNFGTVWGGVFGSALMFGLWHILPALEMHSAHSMTSALGEGWRAKGATVLGTILATGSAGVLFAMLRVWSGSVLAPMGLHWAMNSTGSIAAWLVARRIANGARGRERGSVDAALVDAGSADAPLTDAPLADAPLADGPLADAPLADIPLADAPPDEPGPVDPATPAQPPVEPAQPPE